MPNSVMVIGGDSATRQNLLSYLGDLGFTARAYADVRTALAAFRDKPQEYDLIIGDASIRNTPGLDLMRELRFIRPTVDLVLMSERDLSRTCVFAAKAA